MLLYPVPGDSVGCPVVLSWRGGLATGESGPNLPSVEVRVLLSLWCSKTSFTFSDYELFGDNR